MIYVGIDHTYTKNNIFTNGIFGRFKQKYIFLYDIKKCKRTFYIYFFKIYILQKYFLNII